MLDLIGSFLQSHNIGTVNQDIFFGYMPDDIDVNTTIYENSGFPPSLTFDNENVEYRGLQVICRGTDYVEVKTRIENIYRLLTCNVIDGLLSIIPSQSPFSIGKDEKSRDEFSVNFKVIKNM